MAVLVVLLGGGAGHVEYIFSTKREVLRTPSHIDKREWATCASTHHCVWWMFTCTGYVKL